VGSEMFIIDRNYITAVKKNPVWEGLLPKA